MRKVSDLSSDPFGIPEVFYHDGRVIKGHQLDAAFHKARARVIIALSDTSHPQVIRLPDMRDFHEAAIDRIISEMVRLIAADLAGVQEIEVWQNDSALDVITRYARAQSS